MKQPNPTKLSMRIIWLIIIAFVVFACWVFFYVMPHPH